MLQISEKRHLEPAAADEQIKSVHLRLLLPSVRHHSQLKELKRSNTPNGVYFE